MSPEALDLVEEFENASHWYGRLRHQDHVSSELRAERDLQLAKEKLTGYIESLERQLDERESK